MSAIFQAWREELVAEIETLEASLEAERARLLEVREKNRQARADYLEARGSIDRAVAKVSSGYLEPVMMAAFLVDRINELKRAARAALAGELAVEGALKNLGALLMDRRQALAELDAIPGVAPSAELESEAA